MPIGNKILVFQHNSSSIICYDIEKYEWSEETCLVTEDLLDFSCTKLP